MSIHALFWFFVLLFALIGMFRGFTKEALVLASVFLALSLIAIAREYIPYFQQFAEDSMELFWIRVSVLLLLILLGYQTVNIDRFAGRIRQMDMNARILGTLTGAINGYMIIGSLWYFIIQANYPFPELVIAPVPGTPWGDLSLQLQNFLALNLLTDPWTFGITFILFFLAIGLFF